MVIILPLLSFFQLRAIIFSSSFFIRLELCTLTILKKVFHKSKMANWELWPKLLCFLSCGFTENLYGELCNWFFWDFVVILVQKSYFWNILLLFWFWFRFGMMMQVVCARGAASPINANRLARHFQHFSVPTCMCTQIYHVGRHSRENVVSYVMRDKMVGLQAHVRQTRGPLVPPPTTSHPVIFVRRVTWQCHIRPASQSANWGPNRFHVPRLA